MREAAAIVLILISSVAAVTRDARADAIVSSQAMLANTIAEFFIEAERVTVELEIGLEDIAGFRNLLPDELYEKLDGPSLTLRERHERFFQHEFAIVADGGSPLDGRVIEIGPRPRIRRDIITGEPLADEDGEQIVIFARLEYRLESRPSRLTLYAPRTSEAVSIGFVAYHRQIAINDFRYLSAAQEIELDWDDPWYSSFSARALRRSYSAPMSGFIYVEPYEVRKEIILRPKDLQAWVDLGLADMDTIPAEMQPGILRGIGEFLRDHHPVEIDGRSIVPELARVNFLERTLRTSRVISEPRDLDVDSAIVGAIFVYPIDTPLPQRVTMEWDLWNERIQRVPGSAVDEAGPLPSSLDPGSPILEWRNFLKNPKLPTLRVLAAPPSGLSRIAYQARWPLVFIAALALLFLLRGSRRQSFAVRGGVLVLFAVAAGSFFLGRDAQLSDDRARELVSGLLHNIYRAFDFRSEEQSYDVLARSVKGDLLAEIYLETRRGLELANQGGARAKVKQIELEELTSESAAGGGFKASATWKVTGSVGHWGHIHQRQNQYQATLHVAPVEGEWKLIGLDILEEKRL
jgi:hypothetical protein